MKEKPTKLMRQMMILKTLKAWKESENHLRYLTGKLSLYLFQKGLEILNLSLLSLIIDSVLIILTGVAVFFW